MHPGLAPDVIGRGVKSDHSIATVDYALTAKKTLAWMTKKRRKYSAQRLKAFTSELQSINWWKLLTGTSNKMATDLQKILLTITDKHFPFEEIRSKEGDAVHSVLLSI